MTQKTRYYTVKVECEYSETRVVEATNATEAAKRAKTSNYIGVLGSMIGRVTFIESVRPSTQSQIDEMNYLGRRYK